MLHSMVLTVSLMLAGQAEAAASVVPSVSPMGKLVIDIVEPQIHAIVETTLESHFVGVSPNPPLRTQGSRAANFNKETCAAIKRLDWWPGERQAAGKSVELLLRQRGSPALQAAGVAMAADVSEQEALRSACVALVYAERPLDAMLLPACAICASAQKKEFFWRILIDAIVERPPSAETIEMLAGYGVMPNAEQLLECLQTRADLSESDHAVIVWLALKPTQWREIVQPVVQRTIASWKKDTVLGMSVWQMSQAIEGVIECDALKAVLASSGRHSSMMETQVLRDVIAFASPASLDCVAPALKEAWLRSAVGLDPSEAEPDPEVR